MLRRQDVWPGSGAFFIAMAHALFDIGDQNRLRLLVERIAEREFDFDHADASQAYKRLQTCLLVARHSVLEGHLASPVVDDPGSSQPIDKHMWHGCEVFFDVCAKMVADLDAAALEEAAGKAVQDRADVFSRHLLHGLRKLQESPHLAESYQRTWLALDLSLQKLVSACRASQPS